MRAPICDSLPYLFEEILYVQVVGEQSTRIDQPLLADSLQKTNTFSLRVNWTVTHLHTGFFVRNFSEGKWRSSVLSIFQKMWQLVIVILSWRLLIRRDDSICVSSFIFFWCSLKWIIFTNHWLGTGTMATLPKTQHAWLAWCETMKPVLKQQLW